MHPVSPLLSARKLANALSALLHVPSLHEVSAVPTKKKSGATPKNKALYARVKAEAKRKFDVWPSAYASGWLTKEYKKRGGTYA